MKFVVFILSLFVALGAQAGGVEVFYSHQSEIYNHPIFKTNHHYSNLTVTFEGKRYELTLPETGEDAAVFEGPAPRWMFYSDNATDTGELSQYVVEVFAVKSYLNRGSALVYYRWREKDGWKKIDETPALGTPNRWMSLSYFATNGWIRIGVIDRPHLDGTARLYRIKNDRLVLLDSYEGVSNHKIGKDFIVGGRVSCDGQDHWVVPDKSWRNWVSLDVQNDKIVANVIGPYEDMPALHRTMHVFKLFGCM